MTVQSLFQCIATTYCTAFWHLINDYSIDSLEIMVTSHLGESQVSDKPTRRQFSSFECLFRIDRTKQVDLTLSCKSSYCDSCSFITRMLFFSNFTYVVLTTLLWLCTCCCCFVCVNTVVSYWLNKRLSIYVLRHTSVTAVGLIIHGLQIMLEVNNQ